MKASNFMWDKVQFPSDGPVDQSFKPKPLEFEDGTEGILLKHNFEKLFELDGDKWVPWVQGLQTVMLTGMMGFFTSDVKQKSLISNPKESRYGFKIFLEFPESKFDFVFCITKFTKEQYEKIDDDKSILCEFILGKHKHSDGIGNKAFWGKWNKEYYPYMPIDQEKELDNDNEFKERMTRIFASIHPESRNDHEILEIF